MFRFILIAIAVVSIGELLVLISVGQAIGLFWTITLVLLSAIIGSSIAKREGIEALRTIQAQLRTGTPPGDAILEAVSIFIGGFLLLLPGFLTDIVGIILLLPLTRRVIRDKIKASIRKKLLGRVRIH